MTEKQIRRAARKLWASVTRYDGYQPFGWDWVTMDMVHPGFRIAARRLQMMLDKLN